MADLQIGAFSVTITATVIDGPMSEVALISAAEVVAGATNVELGLTLKDEYGNLVSGTYEVKVMADGSLFNDPAVVFTNGVANVIFGITEAKAHIDIPVFIVIPV